MPTPYPAIRWRMPGCGRFRTHRSHPHPKPVEEVFFTRPLTKTDPLVLAKMDPLFAHTDVDTAKAEGVIADREGRGSGNSRADADRFQSAPATFPVKSDPI